MLEDFLWLTLQNLTTNWQQGVLKPPSGSSGGSELLELMSELLV